MLAKFHLSVLIRIGAFVFDLNSGFFCLVFQCSFCFLFMLLIFFPSAPRRPRASANSELWQQLLETIADVRLTLELLAYCATFLTLACGLYVTFSNFDSPRFLPEN